MILIDLGGRVSDAPATYLNLRSACRESDFTSSTTPNQSSPNPHQQSFSTMARTEEAEAFFHAVYTAVQEIPVGKVTTYGHIARLVGTRESFLPSLRPCTLPLSSPGTPFIKFHPSHDSCTIRDIYVENLSDPASRFNNENVPWQRVINAKGTISPRYIHLTAHSYKPSQPSGARNQAEALQAEDVEVSRTAMGEFTVDFSSYGWFPDVLPSEEDPKGHKADGPVFLIVNAKARHEARHRAPKTRLAKVSNTPSSCLSGPSLSNQAAKGSQPGLANTSRDRHQTQPVRLQPITIPSAIILPRAVIMKGWMVHIVWAKSRSGIEKEEWSIVNTLPAEKARTSHQYEKLLPNLSGFRHA
ncbi:6-O-methylguanine DNA methyltransferase [Colletotrichum lupini]|uniref:6-O-methylguanine DNA methyltransferase n=1 Tax=Colletotrichum lupini TaxID=145971 RepID=A0A9Q8WA45_9PEZI|nr:6-O-methylguanine DNA methyltransferase [Colletotrichum lupini]UQC74990.1 6-O-methylguanine DNA methyltransferase [Colletotrichum lupini]